MRQHCVIGYVRRQRNSFRAVRPHHAKQSPLRAQFPQLTDNFHLLARPVVPAVIVLD
jgi:hypothetical protein